MDKPLVADANRLIKLVKSFPLSPILGGKLAQATTLHEAATVFLAHWMLYEAWPEPMNQYQQQALSLARNVAEADDRVVISAEVFTLAGRKDKQESTYRDFGNKVQARLTTTAHSVEGSASFAEAGGLSDEARREQGRARADHGIYRGPRRVSSKQERVRVPTVIQGWRSK